ncbi:MAG: hypothetical protein H6622_16355 [Halobacteriovoraceae bacterium]|nr:hypothetical protein [Halobacteriovoraceae bacterium]
MRKLLAAERYILEVLNNNHYSFNELKDKSKLDDQILRNLLSNFLDQEVVCLKNGIYSIDTERVRGLLSEANDTDFVHYEIDELISSFLELKFDKNERFKESTHLSLKKVDMNPSEYVLYKSMVKNIETYLEQLIKNPNRDENSQKYIFFWGNSFYSDVINQMFCS